MSNISLEAAVRTCKVNTGWANRIQSDRFENSNLMMCPVWGGRDLTGRAVCADSFYTKREGCNSPLDRIGVENSLRPQYMEYVTLNSDGIQGDMYQNTGVGVENYKEKFSNNFMEKYKEQYVKGQEKTMPEVGSTTGIDGIQNVHNITGQFGINTGFRQNIDPSCARYPYEYAMSQMSQQERYRQGLRESSENYRQNM